jgi:DNA-binding transcriptional ArsR family regulator
MKGGAVVISLLKNRLKVNIILGNISLICTMTSTRLDLEQMHQSAVQACQLMKVLANPDRLMILCQLAQSELRVGQIEEMLGIAQPTLSQQLTVLREQKLVSTRREGKSIHYRVASPQALAVISTLYEQFCKA